MPQVSWFLFAIAVTADVVSLIGAVRDSRTGSPWRRLAWAISLVVLTGIVTYQAIAIRNYTATRNEAKILVKSWPSVSNLEFTTKGELIGVVLSGLRFLEHHRAEYPETFSAAQSLVHTRLNDFRAPPDLTTSLSEYGQLKDGAGAMIQLMRSIAGPEDNRI